MTQLVLPLETVAALGREDFIVCDANRDAVAFVDAYPNWPAPAAALHGPAGSGKSHLVAAWAKQAQASVIAASALDRSVLKADGAMAVEDVEGLGGGREAVLFALIERGTPLLLTARDPPRAWTASMPDLVSRYRALLSFPLWAPDDALLARLARKLFDDRQLAVPDAVIERMVRALERSPAAIRDFVARADAKALAEKRAVTVAMVRSMAEES